MEDTEFLHPRDFLCAVKDIAANRAGLKICCGWKGHEAGMVSSRRLLAPSIHDSPLMQLQQGSTGSGTQTTNIYFLVMGLEDETRVPACLGSDILVEASLSLSMYDSV